MKKFFLLILILYLFSTPSLSFAQQWFDVGVKGSYNSTWLFNKNILYDQLVSYKPSFGYNGGVKIGYNFNENVELTLDFIYTAFNQTITDNIENTDWKKQTNLIFYDIPLLFRYNKEGSYTEAGFQYSSLHSAKESLVSTPSDVMIDYSYSDTKKNFSPNNWAFVFGVGSYLGGTQNATFMLGFRFAYTLNDILSDAGGKGKSYPYPEYPGFYGKTTSYKATNALSGGVILEINYDLGYFVSSKCTRAREFLFFD